MSKQKEIDAINYTIALANDFITKSKALIEFLEIETFTSTSKIRSSARRSSMDLTRALTEFRKS